MKGIALVSALWILLAPGCSETRKKSHNPQPSSNTITNVPAICIGTLVGASYTDEWFTAHYRVSRVIHGILPKEIRVNGSTPLSVPGWRAPTNALLILTFRAYETSYQSPLQNIAQRCVIEYSDQLAEELAAAAHSPSAVVECLAKGKQLAEEDAWMIAEQHILNSPYRTCYWPWPTSHADSDHKPCVAVRKAFGWLLSCFPRDDCPSIQSDHDLLSIYVLDSGEIGYVTLM